MAGREHTGLITPALNAPDLSIYKAPVGGRKRHGRNSGDRTRASQLYEALRGELPSVEEEIAHGPDWHEAQRLYLQEEKDERTAERLERRADVGPPASCSSVQRCSSEHNRTPVEAPPRGGVNEHDAGSRRSSGREHRRGSMEHRRQSSERRSGSTTQGGDACSSRPALPAANVISITPAPPATAAVVASEVASAATEADVAVPRLARSPDAAPEGAHAQKPGAPTVHRSDTGPLAVADAAPEPAVAAERRSSETSPAAAAAMVQQPVADVVRCSSGAEHAVATTPEGCSPASIPDPDGHASAGEHANAVFDSQSQLLATSHTQLQAALDEYQAQYVMSSLTDEDYFAATSVLAAVERAYPSPSRVDWAAEVDGGAGGIGAAGDADGADGDRRPASAERSSRGSPAAGAEHPSPAPEWPWHQSAPATGGSVEDATQEVLRAHRASRYGVQASASPFPHQPRGAGSLDAGPWPPTFAGALPQLALVEVQPLTDHRAAEADSQSQRSLLEAPAAAAGTGVRGPGAAQDKGGAAGGGGGGANERTVTADSMATYEELGDLSQYSLIRQLTIRLCSNPDFEMIVTAVIFANCITLCLFNPRKAEGEGMNQDIFWAELAFNICFTVEVVLRIISLGSAWAYIRRPWNQFDLFMVVAGYTVFVPGNSSAVNAIRALRALRPLRTITRFESLRGVIVCFLEAVPLLASVGGLLIFFVFLYAVAAVQLFPRAYHWTCLDLLGQPLDIGEDPDMFGCGGSGRCPANYTCTLLDKPSVVNVAGYDNTGLAMLSVWQALTLTGWVFMMYRTVDAYSLVAVIYYVTLVFIGAYFVLNLFLAVLKIKFAKAQTLFHNQLALKRGKARRNSIITFVSKVQTKWTEYSSMRSKSALLNSRLSFAISSRMSELGSVRMSGAQVEGFLLNSGQEGSAPKPYDGDRSGPRLGPAGAPPVRIGNSVGADGDAQGSKAGAAGVADESRPVAAATAASVAAVDTSQGDGSLEIASDERPEAPGVARTPVRSALADMKHGSGPNTPKGGRSFRAVSFHRRDYCEPPRPGEGGVEAATDAPEPSARGVWRQASRGNRVAPGTVPRPVAEASELLHGAKWVLRSPLSPEGHAAPAARRCAAPAETAGSGGIARDLAPGGRRLPAAGGGACHAHSSAPSTCLAARWDAPGALGSPRSSLSGLANGGHSSSALAATTGSRGASTLRTLRLLAQPGPVAEAVRFAGGHQGDAAAMAASNGQEGALPSAHADSGAVLSPSASRQRGGEAPLPAAGAAASRPLVCGGAAEAAAVRTATGGSAGAPGAPGGGAAEQGMGERTYSAAPSSMGATNVAMIVMSAVEFDEFVADHPYWERQMLRLQYRTRILVNHNLFNQFFMLLIFVNTVLLALEYDNQPDSLTLFLTDANYVLTGLFTTEMVLKLFGLGFWDYIRDGFNLFDALVVAVSLLEIILSSLGGLNAARALRVLKALRVLRLFKLFRYMQSLRRIGEVLLSAFTSFAAIATLLMLFWVVFSIMGMHVFGAKDLDVYPWPNFSTFLYSLVATWNVLNLENWQNTMYAVTRQTDYGSSLFFVFWIIIGRYIFLTLFLAVTLEAFEAKYDPNAVRLGAKGGIASILSSLFTRSSGYNNSSISRASSGASSVNGSFSGGRRSESLDIKRIMSDPAVAAREGDAKNQPDTGEAQPGFGADASPAMVDRSVSRRLRPGAGYFEDVKAAAAAPYGDVDEPRVHLKKMYTIKQWIDTGNMDVLKAETPEPGPARWTDGTLRSRMNTMEGSGSLSREARPQHVAAAGCSSDGRPSAARGTRGMDDSAAQSLASSESVARGGAPQTVGRPRPVAEGRESGGLDSPSPDPVVAAAPHLPPSALGGDSSGAPSRCASPVPSAGHGRTSPGPVLQSLTREVRRSVQGFARPAGAEDAGLDVEDLVSNTFSGGTHGAPALHGVGGAGLQAAQQDPGAAGIRSPSMARGRENGGLILSRVYGRSVRLGGPSTAPRRASLNLAPPVQVWTANAGALQQQQQLERQPATVGATVAGAGAEAGPAHVPSSGSASPVTLDPDQPPRTQCPMPPPAPLRGGGLSPELLRLAGTLDGDEEPCGGADAVPAAAPSPTPAPFAAEAAFVPAAAAAAATVRAFTTTSTDGQSPSTSLSNGPIGDLLASFMDPVRLATAPVNSTGEVGAAAGQSDSEVIMATFQDLLAQPSPRGRQGWEERPPTDSAVSGTQGEQRMQLPTQQDGPTPAGQEQSEGPDQAVDMLSTWPLQACVQRDRRCSGMKLSLTPRRHGDDAAAQADVASATAATAVPATAAWDGGFSSQSAAAAAAAAAAAEPASADAAGKSESQGRAQRQPAQPSLGTEDSSLLALADELAKTLAEQRSAAAASRDGDTSQSGLSQPGSADVGAGLMAREAGAARPGVPQTAASWEDTGFLAGAPVGAGLGSGALTSGHPTAQNTPRDVGLLPDGGPAASASGAVGAAAHDSKSGSPAVPSAADFELAAAVQAVFGDTSGDGSVRASASRPARLQDSAHSMERSSKPMLDAGCGGRVAARLSGAGGAAESPPAGATTGDAASHQPQPLLSQQTATTSALQSSRGSSVTGLLGDVLSERLRSAVLAAAASGSGKGLADGFRGEPPLSDGRWRGNGGGNGPESPPLGLADVAAPGGGSAARSGRNASMPSASGAKPALSTSGAATTERDAIGSTVNGEKDAPNAMESGSDIASRANSLESRASGVSGASHTSGSGVESERQEHKKRYHKRRRASILIEGTGKSFWIWDEDHPARERAYWLVTHKRFEYAMFALIILNCVALALENPYIEPGSSLEKALTWSNIGFTILFSMEALLKIFAYTFVAYIKHITNQVDFLIVVTSVLEIILLTITSSVAAVSALRVLRAIKPLRLLTRSAGMRLVFKSVTMSLMSMANVSIVCILFFLIFAILGVQLFAGRFYRCNDNTVSSMAECVGNFTDPATNAALERTWKNDWPNFDNTGNALMCCFITATLNGYTEIMVNAMSAPVERGFQPRQFQNPGAFFWFFGFIVVCAFTLLNLYVGVIFSQFSKIRMLSETGSAFLTADQNEWAELTKMVFRLKPPDKAQLPTGRLRRYTYHVVHSRSFDAFILTIILVNVGFLAASWYGEPESYTRQKDRANIVFTACFAAEAAAKMFALGWVGYFKVAWNKLDFFLLVLGVLDLILSMLHTNFLRILRIFRIQKIIALVRIARFAQLVKSVKGIQSLFTTLVYSLPAFGNVGALIGLFFFMYAYVGTFLFGKVQYGDSLNHHANFHNFFRSLLVLMRVATGDNWTGIMFDCMVQPPKCDRSSGGCGSYLAIPYFLTFVLLITVILLNLFTAVIIETFEKTHEQEEWKLSPQALDDFVTLWSEYDDGSGTILPRHLEELLLRLDPPLGLGPYADSKDVLRFVYDLDIPLVNARVPFHKTAFELVKRCSQATMPEGAIKEQIDRLVDKFFHELTHQDETLNFSVAVTVMKVQRKWRTRMRAAKLMRKKRWRQDRREAPSYTDILSNKMAIAEKYDSYKEWQREKAKEWESTQQSYGRKPDKAEVARRMEPRWRFNAKYAPPALMQATASKTSLLEFGKRAINVNKIVGLFRGGRLGGSTTHTVGGGDASVAGGSVFMQRSTAAVGDRAPSPAGATALFTPRGEAPPGSPMPKLLRSITHTTGQLVFRTSYGGGVTGPTPAEAVSAGRQSMGPGAFSSSGVADGPGSRNVLHLSRAMSRRLPTLSNDGTNVLPDLNRGASALSGLTGFFRGAGNRADHVRGIRGADYAGTAPGELSTQMAGSQQPKLESDQMRG